MRPRIHNRWSNRVCVPVIGRMVNTIPQLQWFGDTLILYSMNSNPTIINFPSSEVQCENPGAPSNGYAQGSAPYRAGDVVQFNCNPEYMMQGQPIIACQDSGRWSNNLPKCKGIFVLRRGGSLYYSHKESFKDRKPNF